MFLLKERGFPITEIFEREIKDIPTTRFSKDFDETYKTLYYEYTKKQASLIAKVEKAGVLGLYGRHILMRPRALSER